jgi:hypothetical protein
MKTKGLSNRCYTLMSREYDNTLAHYIISFNTRIKNMNKITTKKIIGLTDQAEQNVKMTKRKMKRLFNWRVKFSACIVGGIVSAGLLFYGFYNVSKWYDAYRVLFQNPVIVRSPVLVEARQVATSSAKTQARAEIEPFLPIINEAYRKVRTLESGAGNGRTIGTHTYCQSIGEVNEIGYLVDGNRKFCFTDYGEQFLTFKKWFQKRLPDMSLDEALCLWNTGTRQPMCTYSQKYHSL